MKIRITNNLLLKAVPENLRTEICSKLIMTNPKWIENNQMGRSNYKTPRLLRYYQQAADGALIIPRGFGNQLVRLARQFGVSVLFDDQRRVLPDHEFYFQASLRGYQEIAVEEASKRDWGVLTAPTGSGKTMMALSLVAKRKQPTLVVVHTKELLNQWLDRIVTFLNIPKTEIGIIGVGQKKLGNQIMVGMVQTLYKCAEEVSKHIGHIIVDECHRAPSRTFTEAVTAFDCKYMLGLSATPYRRDKLSRLIFWYLGDMVHEVDKSCLIKNGNILKAEVITRETAFKSFHDPSAEYSKMLSELTSDIGRNHLIASDVAQQANNGGGICLVLSDRKGHCVALKELLEEEFNINAEVLTGDIPAKKRIDIVDRLNHGEIKTLVATGQLIGEGFDCKGLSTLFLATPIKFGGRVLQYLGRVLRPAPGKEKATVYDYIDSNVGVLAASAKARQRVYNAN